jgi:KaiC/GvpD/RAD55 family RecA-like ATPase
VLTVDRALALSWKAGPELPRIPALTSLYQHGVRFRQGETVMIAGRPGSQKSGFALWLAVNFGLPTLYCSADMSSFTASTRVAGMQLGMSTEQVEQAMAAGGLKRQMVMDSLKGLPLTFSHDSPITWSGLDQELKAYIELNDRFPQLMVIDNLMDIEGCETDFAEQQKAMAEITALSRNTGATIIVLHHAQENAQTDPAQPPSRGEIHNKVAQKPELVLTVGLDPHSHAYRVACVKQRMGACDPSAKDYSTLQAYPDSTRFGPFNINRTSRMGPPAGVDPVTGEVKS